MPHGADRVLWDVRRAEGSSELGTLELTLEGGRIRKAGSFGGGCVHGPGVWSIAPEQWGTEPARCTNVCLGRCSSEGQRAGQDLWDHLRRAAGGLRAPDLSLLSQIQHLGYGGVRLCGTHQAGVNRVSDDPALGVQQDGLHVTGPRPEGGSVSPPTGFQQELPPSLNGSSGEGGLGHHPLSGSRALRPWFPVSLVPRQVLRLSSYISCAK